MNETSLPHFCPLKKKTANFTTYFQAKNLAVSPGSLLFSTLPPPQPISTCIKKKMQNFFFNVIQFMSFSCLKPFTDFIPHELVEGLDLPSLSGSPLPPPTPLPSHPRQLARYIPASLASFLWLILPAEFSHLLVPQPVMAPSVLLVPWMSHLSGLYKGPIFRKAFPDHPS